MFIKSLHLKNFKRFKTLDLDFPGDITVVKGPNEKGKSTIALAFIAGLFYNPRKSNEAIRSLKAWGSPKMYEITIDFEEMGENYRLTKDFEKKKTSLVNLTTGRLMEDFQEINDILYKFGGYRSPILFESTALVKEESVREISSGKKEIDEAMQDLITSGKSRGNVNNILKKIEEAISELTRGLERPAKKLGTLKGIESRLEESKARLLNLKKLYGELEEEKKKLGEFREEYKKVSDELDLAKRQFDQNLIYFQSQDNIKKISKDSEKIEEDYQSLEMLDKEQKILQENIQNLSYLERINFKDFWALEKEIKLKEEEFKKLEIEEKDLEAKKIKKEKQLKLPYKISIMAGVLLGFLGFLISGWFFLSWFFAGLLLLAALFSERVFETVDLKKIVLQKKSFSKELNNLSNSFKKRLAQYQVKNLKELENKIEELSNLKEREGHLSAKIEAISRGRELTEIEKERKSTLRSLALEEAKITLEQKVNPPIPQDQRKLEKKLEVLEKERKKLFESLSETKASIKKTPVTQEDIIRQEEEIERLEEEMRQKKRKLQILEVLKIVLLEAKSKTIGKIKEKLEQYLEKYLSDITRGKYCRVQVENDLGFKVWSPEKKEEIAPDESLSRGTIDQFYLAARFAFLKILFPGKTSSKPFIILDDPFQSFDSERRSRTRELIKTFSQEFQIILLTHSDLYDGWGEVREI